MFTTYIPTGLSFPWELEGEFDSSEVLLYKPHTNLEYSPRVLLVAYNNEN